MRRSCPRFGLSLVEVLIVVAIIAILIAMLLPAIQVTRESARRTQCANNLRQLGLAFSNYESARKSLPPGDKRGFELDSSRQITKIKSLGTWVTLSLPFLEQSALYDQVDFEHTYFSPENGAYHHVDLETLKCPSDVEVGLTSEHYGARGNYAANIGLGYVWMSDPYWTQNSGVPGQEEHPRALPISNYRGQQRRPSLWGFGPFLVNRGVRLRQVKDGLSHTVALCELRKASGEDTRGALHYGAGVLYVHDYVPNDPHAIDRTRYCVSIPGAPCEDAISEWRGAHQLTARSRHPHGVNVAWLDTSVRFVTNDVALETWQAMATFRGGESVAALR
ncbi:MAG: DUF1559 domain-containing protein [Planctomycetales bacterium]|nr:DUF1559 domain-containing protein [Planctomycetales bacterium]